MSESPSQVQTPPTREELNAELLPVPEPPELPPTPEPPGTDKIIEHALGHVRGKRGGDLVAVILTGSGARRALTAHSDLDFIVLVKGHDEGQEIIRIADRLVDIRYWSAEAVEEELSHSPRLPPLLRKARVLFEHDVVGTKLIDKAQQRFRQGPPQAGMHEKIRFKAECLHWLGRAEDLTGSQPATVEYFLATFFEELMQAFFRVRGLWITAPADMIRFAASRDAAFGDLLERFQGAPTTAARLDIGRQLAQQLFKDIPNPQRID
ncbi:MAG: nucleotidyltransferase domain-containing protein [Burkholderiales bacterium]